jgi:serine/threonine-protein kinase
MTVRLDKGTTLGERFRLEELIGAGGMGAVYAAWDLQQGHRVAVKILDARLAADSGLRERFLAESRLASRLTHPHIVPVYAHGRDEGCDYLAMPLVETDLGAMIGRDGALDVTRALNIAEQVAWALDVAHEQGLVHRDVKPENVLLRPRRAPDEPDHAQLADFGIAKLEDAPGLTRTGAFLGTASYASPEQTLSEPLDGRSDQYALACVLFECLTGRPPFAGAGVAEVLAAHREAPRPRPGDHRPELAGELGEALTRGLAVEREARFATCRELVEQVRRHAPAPQPVAATAPSGPPAGHAREPVVAGPPQAATVTGPTAPLPPAPRRLWAVMVGLVAVVALAVGLAVALGAQDGPRADPAASPEADPAPTQAPAPADGGAPAQEPESAPAQEPESPPGQPGALPEATLEVAGDGCGVIRSEFPGSEPDGLQWSVTDGEGFEVLARNALGETQYRYFRPGSYEIVLQAWNGQQYADLSNPVSVTC